MAAGLILTIGSLFFIVLLYLVYFSKQRFLSIRNKIYRYMLIVDLVLIVSELVATISLIYIDNEVLNLFIHRIHWSTGIIWFILLYYYSMVFVSDLSANNLKEIINYDNTSKTISVIFLILGIGYFLAPFDVLNKNAISYIPGGAAYYVFAFCAFCVLAIIINTIKNRKKANKRKIISIFLMILELIIIFVLQISIHYIAFAAIGSAIQMFFLYFNIENPDLKIIKELEIAKDDIERSNKVKSDFLFNMSHEIRSPMNAIIGFSQSLLTNNKFDADVARQDIAHISSAGNSLLDIINNILDISKIESGKETLDKKEYSLKNVIMELSSIIEARLGDKPIKLIMDVDNNIPSVLYGDSTKLFQILLNLLTNAVKYTEVGKIKLSVTSMIQGDYVNLLFKVADTGYGIKTEDFNKLFEKFSRLQEATANEIEGTGLGLVITKKYVDLMGGKIWFESEYEVGTTFYVEIAQQIINKVAIGSITEPIKSNKVVDHLDCSAFRALIVDDNKLNLKVASRLLGAYKFKVDTSDSGKDCIYKIKEGNKYDIIFMDHMMPEMDGIQTMHVLKKLDGYALPPIVALTANAITGMKEMYLKEGFDEYLSKPINIAELDKLLNKYFNK